MQGIWVPSLVSELRSHMPNGTDKGKQTNKKVNNETPDVEFVDLKWKRKRKFEFHQELRSTLKSHWINENLFREISRMKRSPFLNISGEDGQTLRIGKRESEEHSFRARFILTPGLLTIFLLLSAEYDFIFLPTSTHFHSHWTSSYLKQILLKFLELLMFKSNR